MDEQMQDSAEPAGWLIEFKNNIGETITRFYTHNAIGDYRASVDENATSTPLYKRAALSQPAAAPLDEGSIELFASRAFEDFMTDRTDNESVAFARYIEAAHGITEPKATL